MILCVLFSGGKDSTYALHWAIFKGFKLGKLITFIPERDDSWMFQYQNVKFTKFQADSMGLPLTFINTSGEKSSELNDLRRAMSSCVDEGMDGVLTGALLSDYQRMNVNMIAQELNLRVFSPLWRKNQEEYLRWLPREGFSFIITHSASMGFPHDLVGKEIGEAEVERIISASRKFSFNPAFEGGEAETFVVNAPLFTKKINVKGKTSCKGDSCTFIIEKVNLVERVI
ncbi:diphthine--ammonia ligase [Sulfuracidifex metallicus]|uniref:Diphthine--ammonia ligase n=1 Tax=Sulfuracidifex metallicus DSM 6482 = JCM 9184 TaxID=523847 RepID=A0A6A9QM04_SULME|nr:diphthine--ammonia ligase [Sulfuracidifex metallicus]MUN28221.1 diphthine--ammonia ligase [Sulfuracidifex metallicus DSM 6482 = JCM 9184]WOE51247.1 diphthine--ammonia ligase [Sulfuracidifex metallicus DSM 6482 = JCM 9184]